MKSNIYQKVTSQIIENLEKAGSWQKLWEVPQPVSLNGHNYNGINHLLLSSAQYLSPVWGTFLQVRQNGGTVNKGEKSSMVVFWKQLIREQQQTDSEDVEIKKSFMLRYYLVFNSEQCSFDEIGTGKINRLFKASESFGKERYKPADQIIHDMPDSPEILEGTYSTPSYIPALDQIRMPKLEYFFESSEYYSAFFHELVHSTGHKKRLNRFESDQFSNRTAYSREELVAEVGAAYLSTIAGINHDIRNSTAYIKGWLSVLNSYPSWIIWASSKAQKACEHIVPSLAVEKEDKTEVTIKT